MIKRILLALLALFAMPAIAGPWTVGTTHQPIVYTYPHVLGDGSNQRGGEAPAYAYQLPDIPTGSSTVSLWTWPCAGTLAGDQALHPPVGAGCGAFEDAAATLGYGVGHEAKARFDCNVFFEAKDDPIVNPGVQNGASHKHTFIGNSGTSGVAYNVTYASLRASGSSSCYGGVLNRTLYWEPSMFVVKNGITVTIKPRNIVTYYLSGSITDGPVMSIWPRGLEFIGGFDMNDPTNQWGEAPIAAIDPTKDAYYGPDHHPNASTNGFVGWSCSGTASTGDWRTAWSPNQSAPHGSQPYLADASGHPTLNCTQQAILGFGTGILVQADVGSRTCWDGKNLTSPNGRDHMMATVVDQNVVAGQPGGRFVCPDHWYRIPAFEAKVEFAFTDQAEMAASWLSSDRMPGMTQFLNGQSFHFDLIPAWDYGTGDNPGTFVKFMVHCAGVSVHLKNSDGVTYTDIAGDPHECGTGRITATENMLTGAVPDGTSVPNPITNLNPDQTGNNRFFPLTVGSPIGGISVRTHP